MKIVIILSKALNTALSYAMHICQLIFDNSNVNNDRQIKQKMANFFSANLSELSNFSSSSI